MLAQLQQGEAVDFGGGECSLAFVTFGNESILQWPYDIEGMK